jgi:hypothetical protein
MPFSISRRTLLSSLLALVGSVFVAAEPLSKKTDVDFFRDVPSRNLKGLATRSDGRLVAGPVLTELAGTAPADLLWCLEPTADANRWLTGTGADGRIFEVTIDPAKSTYSTREVAKLDDPHVFALRALPEGGLLAGTSPKGGLYFVRDGKTVARAVLPVDSIFDLLLVNEGAAGQKPRVDTALVATGNPGRIYRVDLKKFAASGVATEKLTEPKQLADRGITLFGEVRDRNVRRLARFPDGRIAAGSAPKGNLYVFGRDGGAPVLLQENRDAEVTDLLPQPNGDLYATVVFASSAGGERINHPKTTPPANPLAPEAPADNANPAEKFSGRSALLWFPANAFPETLVSRSNLSFYRVARQGDILVLAGGESGDMLGYDLQRRFSLTFAGSVASQLNDLGAVPGSPGRFLVLKNNAPGFALLDFNASGPREAETRRLDLGVPATIGALQFNRLRSVETSQLNVAFKTNFGSDELEGWSPWTQLAAANGGWKGEELRGRYLKVRLQLPPANPGNAGVEVDKASLYFLPQNRRPTLVDFRFVAPNYGLIAASEPMPSSTISLGQLLGRSSGGSGGDGGDDKKKGAFLSSQVVPQPGTQLVLWTVGDSDGDNLAYTFSIRRDGDPGWTDLALGIRDPYVQFDISHLAEGTYFTRLVATEQAPRPVEQRLTANFETDDLVVDRTAPEVLDASVRRDGATLHVSVHGRDALSLLDGVEFVFNNGVHEIVEQPADGIRDGRDETFVLEVPQSKVADATSVEVVLYDVPGNSAARRVSLAK